MPGYYSAVVDQQLKQPNVEQLGPSDGLEDDVSWHVTIDKPAKASEGILAELDESLACQIERDWIVETAPDLEAGMKSAVHASAS